MTGLRFSAALGLAAAAFVGSAAGAPPPGRPNVLIVLTDDQGMGDFSCFGNPVLKTPNLDRLRAGSVRFTDFHVTPMCTPTRGQLMTGVDAVRNGATSVTGGRSFIRPGLPTAAEIFAAAGYKTGLFGKWHLGDNYPHRPMDRGFQEAVYHLGWGFTSAPEFTNTLFDGRYFHNGVEKKFSGHCTDVWFGQAMAWMKARKDAGEPFFLYLPTNAPHAPLVVAEKYSAPYEGKGPAGFFGMIAQIDENMGRLDAFLRETGLAENTILVFATDNGGTAGVKLFNAGLRGGKITYYDGGHRVPCFVRWPAGKLGEPRDIAGPVQVQDLLPTLLELTGVPAPASAKFDGLSLAGVLRGTAPVPERMFVVQYSRAKLEKWQCCVVWKNWRLVHGTELYDVDADRAQARNLAAEKPDVVARLRAHYEKWWADLEPKIGEFVATTLGSEKQPVVRLTSSDWQDVYCDNSRHVSTAVGGPRGGHWNIHVEAAGTYEVTLRRWPPELKRALGADNGPMTKGFPGIASVRVAAAGADYDGSASPTEESATVRVKLPAGRTTLQAWFRDAAGADLCGAFYADVRRAE